MPGTHVHRLNTTAITTLGATLTLVVGAGLFAPAPPATAASPDLDLVSEARQQLSVSGLPHTVETVAGRTTDSYRLDTGTVLSIPRGASTAESRLGAGTQHGIYITLNRVDQGALASGSAAALGIAICAIPAVGWAACALVAGALVTGAYYIAAHGICPPSKPLLKTYLKTGVTGCVKS